MGEEGWGLWCQDILYGDDYLETGPVYTQTAQTVNHDLFKVN